MKSLALQLFLLASFAPCLISSQDAPLPAENPVSTSLVFVTHGPPRPVIPLPGESATSLAGLPGNNEPNPTSLPVTEPVTPGQPVATSVLGNDPGSEPADQPSEPQPTTLPAEAAPGVDETAFLPSTGPEGGALPETPGAGQLPTTSPSDPVQTSVNDGNGEPNPGEDPDATESGSPETNSPGDGDGIASSTATSASQDENSLPIDENTQPVVSQTQAPSEGGSTVTQDVPMPPQVTSEAADPKSTAEGDGPPVTAAPGAETEGELASVTGTDDEVITWSAVQDPEHTDNTETITQTDDDGVIIPIFPGGWKWSRLDGLKGGPLPTGNPKPISNGKDDPKDDDKDEDDDDDDDDEEECTTTAPPKCTLTLSYYTGEDGEGTSTRIGSCAPVTGCVSGEQSTTTTTIASDVPRITGILEKDNSGREDIDLGPMEEDTVKYFSEMFKKWGISSNSTEAEPPQPSCDMYAYGADADCMELFSASFCDAVDEDNNETVSRNFTYDDVVGDAKRAVATGAERRSLWRRQSKCSSHEFDFEWTGGGGSCDLSCSKAYSQLQTQCHRSLYFAGLATKGSIDVGCGTYSYRVSKKVESPPSGSATTTSEAKPKTAEPKPTTTEVTFEVRNLQCNNEDDFRGHADISDRAVYKVIEDACSHSSHEDLYMTPDSEPYVKEFEDIDTHKHRVTWSWVEGCSMKDDKVKIFDPLDEGILPGNNTRCGIIMGDTWWDCNNGGVGGSEDVGCVRYKLDSGI
ncbi:uncharacterized protein FSUBG_2103 [Fusarium subglutinans]|uniref:Uncharacterized protein n=1 Tax=Gibberella subglutinans TaxID=42677 RepID=A0A8H5Q9H3_GIBSU|nr:uncharacterized protein FSUBG_2103 [Fusarium subglutinans]KAF5611666.1 hypothetical protein FSUBG_2103 [Fusarium subglutinans]